VHRLRAVEEELGEKADLKAQLGNESTRDSMVCLTVGLRAQGFRSHPLYHFTYDPKREAVSFGPSARSGTRDIQRFNLVFVYKPQHLAGSYDCIRLFGIDKNVRSIEKRAQIARQPRPTPQRFIVENCRSIAVDTLSRVRWR
jgi:hypothetical protein